VFGLTLDKLVLLGVLAAVLVGPDRLPRAARALTTVVRKLKEFANDAKERVRDEVGPEFDTIDWSRLDPRKYDPRAIVREALFDSADAPGDPDAVAVGVAMKPAARKAETKDSAP
jgi:sec-independent protein translocase protein TatB